MVKVAIFDYGAGNIFSLKNSLEKNGATVDVITDFEKPNVYSGVLLPGVGNFDPAIKSIIKKTKDQFLEFVKDTTPVLGICLGMEMFFERSQEGKESGLGIMGGDVILLPNSMKVPHMGWNSLEIQKQSRLIDGIKDGEWVYFVHSYRANPRNLDVIIANSDYGIKIPAIVEKNNFFGTQFHPEKSGKVGLTMIDNFLKVCRK